MITRRVEASIRNGRCFYYGDFYGKDGCLCSYSDCWFACFGSYGFHTDSKGMAWLDFLPGFGKELRIHLLPL